MPTFDVVSEVDMNEVRTALDQARREVETRFDFKNTHSTIEQSGSELTLHSDTEPRLKALAQVLEEKLVKRQVSLKALSYGRIEDASKGTVRQVVSINAGISQEQAKKLHKLIKDMNLKGVSSSTQGDQLRVSGKKRDDLQAVIANLKAADLDFPLQYQNFRD